MADFKINNVFKKMSSVEKGLVLEKIVRPAASEYVYNGQIVPASPERYFLVCISSCNFNNSDGFVGNTLLNYEVDKAMFDNIKYGANVNCQYTITNSGLYGAKVELVKA